MPVLPGGVIPSGVGGGIWCGAIPDDLTSTGDDDDYFDVATWQLHSLYVNAECTHSGTYGAISRRQVAYDFRFSASVPYDYDNPPEQLLNDGIGVAIRFDLGDVTQDPQLIAAHEQQKFYFAPSAFIDVARTVLDARGDVIRQDIQGSGNSLIFLFPEESAAWNDYKQYLQNRGWNV